MIRAVHVAAFPTEAEAKLVEALRAAARTSVSLVATVGERVVGHVLFSPVSFGGVGLAPVAVLPELQGSGIGTALIRAGLETCRNKGHGFAAVLGEPAYYGRFGFRRALDFGLDNEYGARDEFMVVELKPGALAAAKGIIRYGPEFVAATTRRKGKE